MKKSATISIKPLSAFPEYVAAKRDLDAVDANIAKLDQQIRELDSEISAMRASAIGRDVEAEEYFERVRAAEAADPALFERIRSRRDELAELRRRLEIAKRARAIADQAVFTAVARCSRTVCDELQPEFTARTRAVAEGVIDLMRKGNELKDLRREIERAGYNTGSLFGVPSRQLWARFGRFDDYNSPIRCFLRGCETQGYLKEADYLPSEVKG
jgi:predicted nuclease with TOPRIM domain